jgi:hypothetical protein
MALASILCPPIPKRSQSAGDVTFISPDESIKDREKEMASFHLVQSDERKAMSPYL